MWYLRNAIISYSACLLEDSYVLITVTAKNQTPAMLGCAQVDRADP